jgi:hypothetical protein
MERSGKTGPLLIAVFAAGVILLDFPILFLFTRAVSVAGIPLLYAYVFVAWTALIGLMAYAIERPRE